MREGEIILAPLPQSDGKTKLRPVLLLKQLPRYNDYLVCGISTQLHQIVEDFDELIDKNSTNFVHSGLRQASIIRLGFLSVIPHNKIAGGIGRIDSLLHNNLLKRLADYLMQ